MLRIAYEWLINLCLVFLILDFPCAAHLFNVGVFSLLQRSVKTSYSPAEALNQKGNFRFRGFVWERGFYS